MPERRVLVTDYTWADTSVEAAVLAEVGAELVIAQTGEESELVELVGDCEGILTCFKHVTPAVVRAGDALKVIGRYGIGVDNIAVDLATERGIPVTNVPEYCSDEVAEHALALTFALVRGIGRAGLGQRRIAGMTLGIVGHGSIGRALEDRARRLGMDVLVHTRRGGVALSELAARSDVVSLHVPATPETEHLVDEEFLASMKQDAYLINCARGTVVDHDALLAALEAGTIAGAGLDVTVPEPLPEGHPLLARDDVIVTPHTAFYSDQSIEKLARIAAQNVADVLAGRTPTHIVNPEVLEAC